MIGIYKIQSKIDNKYYIGSSINIFKRWKEHKYELRNNRHSNSHLQNFVNKYTLDNLDFIIIEECTKDNIITREQEYLNTLDKNSFNICINAIAPMTNRKHTIETLDKMSKSQSKENNPIFGTKRPKHVIEAMQKGRSLKRFSTDEKIKRIMNLPNRKPITISKDGESMNCISLAEAAKIIGVSSTTVSKALKLNIKIKGWDCHPQDELIKLIENLN